MSLASVTVASVSVSVFLWTNGYEGAMPQPWTLHEPSEFVERLLRQIVGFRIDIARLEGKWKLNQNQPRERREKVALALRKQPDDNSQAIAAMMGRDNR
jgi:transcriptional regulator